MLRRRMGFPVHIQPLIVARYPTRATPSAKPSPRTVGGKLGRGPTTIKLNIVTAEDIPGTKLSNRRGKPTEAIRRVPPPAIRAAGRAAMLRPSNPLANPSAATAPDRACHHPRCQQLQI